MHHSANAFKVPVCWYHLFSTLLSRVTNWQCSLRTCTIRGFSMPFQTCKSGPGQCSNGISWPWTMRLFDDSMTS